MGRGCGFQGLITQVSNETINYGMWMLSGCGSDILRKYVR